MDLLSDGAPCLPARLEASRERHLPAGRTFAAGGGSRAAVGSLTWAAGAGSVGFGRCLFCSCEGRPSWGSRCHPQHWPGAVCIRSMGPGTPTVLVVRRRADTHARGSRSVSVTGFPAGLSVRPGLGVGVGVAGRGRRGKSGSTGGGPLREPTWCNAAVGSTGEAAEPEPQFPLPASVALGFRRIWPAALGTGSALGGVVGAALGAGGWGGYLQEAGGCGRLGDGRCFKAAGEGQSGPPGGEVGQRGQPADSSRLWSLPRLPLVPAHAQAAGQTKGAPPLAWHTFPPGCHRSLPVGVEAGVTWAVGLLPWRGHPAPSAACHPRAPQVGGPAGLPYSSDMARAGPPR